jgi:hypothetical protein
MTNRYIFGKLHISFFALLCTLVSSCGAFGVKSPVREYSQYPALPLVSKDTRYPAALGFLNSPDYLLGNIDKTELVGSPELKNVGGILYKKSTKSIVKTFDHFFNPKVALVIGDYALGLGHSKLSVASFLDSSEKYVSLDF